MKRSLVAVLAMTVSILMSSCKSADKNAGNIAADYCDCLRSLEKNMSEDSKKIITNAVNADDPSQSIQNDVIALGAERGKEIGEEMQAVGDMDNENSEIGRCINKVEKKYNDTYTANEEKTLRKIIKELDNKPGCTLTAALLKLGLKMKGKPGFEN